MSDSTPDRLPFPERVRAGLQEALEWTQGERRLRGSEKVDGEWVEAEDTGPEFLAGRVKEAIDKYKVILRWSARDKIYIAELPELPGCMADGPTQEEALKKVREVAGLWIEAARGMGRAIPQPEAVLEAA
jgi:predicted RNase H-like HicB family nuclease